MISLLSSAELRQNLHESTPEIAESKRNFVFSPLPSLFRAMSFENMQLILPVA
jgi:hypothetical protein